MQQAGDIENRAALSAIAYKPMFMPAIGPFFQPRARLQPFDEALHALGGVCGVACAYIQLVEFDLDFQGAERVLACLNNVLPTFGNR